MRLLSILIILFIVAYTNEVSLDVNTSVISLENNSDSLNFCFAVSKKNLKYCTNIEDRDKKSLCFGVLQRNSGYCSMIVDKDIKNSCLSIALSDIDYCKKINDKEQETTCISFYLKDELDNHQVHCPRKE